MKLSDVKKILTLKLRRDIKVPDDDDLEIALFEAIYEIAAECEPSELIVHPDDLVDDDSIIVLRSIIDGYFLKVPEFPDFDFPDRHLMLDEELTYAAIYLAITYLIDKPDRTVKYTERAMKIIGAYKANYSKEVE